MPKVKKVTLDPAGKPLWPYEHIVHMTPHLGSGQWCKKIRGKTRYFGKLEDPKAALDDYERRGPALRAGLDPDRGPSNDAVTIGELVQYFDEAQRAREATGTISPRTLRNYLDTSVRVAGFFGPKRRVSSLRPNDFEQLLAAVPFGPTRRGNFVVWVRSIFTWAHETAEILDATPRYGKAFRGAPMKERRQLKDRAGKNMLTPEQLQALLAAAKEGSALRAMIYLGLNGGMGNTDCAELPLRELKLEYDETGGAIGGMIDFPRPKTGVKRIVPLWPETAAAIDAYLKKRPEPYDERHRHLVFITRQREPFVHGNTDALGAAFRDLLVECKVIPKRRPCADKGGHRRAPVVMPLGFYTLRRTFRTIADDVGDQHAAHLIMGHSLPGMSGVYVQRITPERLRKVTDHVRSWALPPPPPPEVSRQGAEARR